MKKSLLFLMFAVILFTACDKEETNITKDASDFTIDGYIIDADGNVPMTDVVVKGAFGDTKTDAKGYFKVTGLNHGSYSVIFQKSGYGEMIQNFTLEANASTPLEVNYTSSTLVYMYKMDQSIETTLWKSINNKKVALANVPFSIKLSAAGNATFLYNKIEGTTDANGKLSLNDTLPNISVSLIVDYIDASENKSYDLTTSFTPSGIEKSYYITGEDVSDKLTLLDANIFDEEGKQVTQFAIDNSLTFEFNKELESESTAKLYNESDGRYVAANISVSGKTLTIDPIGDLIGAKYYSVSLDVVCGNDNITTTYYFYSEGAVESLDKVTIFSLVSDFKVYETTTSVDVKFNIVDGASYYELYGKYGDQTEYQKFTTVYHNTSATATEETASLNLSNALPNMDIPSSGMFADGKKFTIIVRPVANGGDLVGEFSSPLAIIKNATVAAVAN